jgi:hypothetical protein
MTTMRFMSTLRGQPSKVVKFDSSPGRAIAKKLGDGLWDETSYRAELKEGGDDDQVYEVQLRMRETESNPGPHKHQVVGILHWERPRDRSGRLI